jgi:hypothetical protein
MAMGEVYRLQGELDRSCTEYRKALTIHLALLGPTSAVVADAYNNLARVSQVNGTQRMCLFATKLLFATSFATGCPAAFVC